MLLNSCLLVINRSDYYSVCLFCGWFFLYCEGMNVIVVSCRPFSLVTFKPSSQFEPGCVERSGPQRQGAPLSFMKIAVQVRRDILFTCLMSMSSPTPCVFSVSLLL